MKKNRTYGLMDKIGLLKMITIMRFTIFILFLSISQTFAMNSYSQQAKLSLDMRNVRLEDVLDRIEKNSEFFFMYNKDLINVDRKVDIQVEEKNVNEVLNKIFANTDISYSIKDRQILLINNRMTGTGNESSSQQTKSISGKVTDSSNSLLPGVSVVIKGTTTGTITDSNGYYSLSNIPENATLLFSFVGMKTEEVNSSGKTTINITLVEETVGIEEVVAVGYGTQKKRDIIGSISTIKSDALKISTGATNFSSILQGQAAGVSVQSSSGRLGANVDIRVRGLSSISANISPLWIIDGVPVITDVAVGGNGSAAQSPMELINPADIESIQVLKDAAATSIYGSRGSNGVIMVTTKSGVAGKSSVNVDYNTGISDLPTQRVDFLGTTQWFRIKDEAKQGYGLGPFDMISDWYSKKPYTTEFLTRQQAESINTDWRKAIMHTGSYQNVNLSAIGGTKTAQYYISGNYRNDKSVITNENLERYGVRANLDLKPTNSLQVGTKINLSMSKGNRGKNDIFVGDGNNTGSVGGFSYVNYTTVPFEPVYSLANPNLYYNPLSNNPVADSDPADLKEDLDMYRALTSLYGEYTIPHVKGLSVRTELSMDFIQANRNHWISKEIRYNGSMAQDDAATEKTINYNLFLKYNRIFGDHTFDFVGGTESQRSTIWTRSMVGQNLIGNYQQLGTPLQLVSMFSGLSGENYLKSYFARANYKFKDKYLAGISIRRDGSSVFTADYRWGNFLAFSAGWILSDELFMGSFGQKHFLKLRGSYGETGNANIPSKLDVSNYTGNLAYGSADITGGNGTLVSSIGVTNLRWESTKNLDLGLDFGFFDHRIDGSLAYYHKYVKDLLLASTLPPSSGIASIFGNIGDLVNSGVELSVTSSNINSKNFKWSTTLNVAYNHNEVKKLTPTVDQAGTGMVSAPFISKVGYGVRDFYIADWAGVDSQTGLSQLYALDKDYYTQTGETRRLKDANGKDVLLIDNNSNANSNLFHLKGKNTMPKYYGGITNKFTYKAFDLSIFISFSGGNYILDNFRRDLVAPGQGFTGETLADFDNNYWKKPGDKAKYQRLDWNGNIKMDDGSVVGIGDTRTNTTQFLFKGDFVKLKSINLGYTLPISADRKFFCQALRIYANVDNLYTLTKYPGWDPEGLGYISQWDLPQLFSASIGVTIKF